MRVKVITILLTVLVFLSVATLGVSAVYRVNEVTVSVATVSDEANAEAESLRLRLSNAYAKQSIFFVTQEEADSIVEEFPYFRITGFERAYPNRLIVKIAEDEEVYAVPCGENGKYYILGADGTILGIREDYWNRSDGAQTAKNVLITGLSVSGEKGGTLAGDEILNPLLLFCQKAFEVLGGIRRNIATIEVQKLGSSSETVTLKLTTFEGVNIYVRNPSVMPVEKAEKAFNAYMALTDAQRLTGRLAIWDTVDGVKSDYSALDGFENIDEN